MGRFNPTFHIVKSQQLCFDHLMEHLSSAQMGTALAVPMPSLQPDAWCQTH